MKKILIALSLLLAIHWDGIGQTDVAKLDQYLQRAAANGWSGSASVSEKGKLLLDKGYGMADREANRPQTNQTVFSVGSITKQFTAAAIMKLETMGRLKVEDKLSQYFPAAPKDKAAITLHQLLTHSAGFSGAIGDDYENVDAAQFAKLAFDSELLFAPGTAYEYSNVGYSLLGIIVEKVSGQGYEKFLRENLWLPAGMHQTGYLLPGHKPEALAVGYQNGNRWGTALDRPWLPDGPGWHLRANGGVLSTAGDMQLWYQALKNNTVLPRSATEKMFTPFVAEGPEAISHYGYGWVVQKIDDEKLIWHNGGNGVYNANMTFMPDKDRCVVVSSNSNNKISDDIARQLVGILMGKSSNIDAATAQKINGIYRFANGGTFQLFLDENNNITISSTDKTAFQQFVAEGTENPTEVEAVAQRTLRVVETSQKGDFMPLATALGVPIEEATNMSQPFWEGETAANGPFVSAENFCTVSRPKRGTMLAFMQLNFQKKSIYQMFVWKGAALMDVQMMEVPDKHFDYQEGPGLTFFSPSNDMTLEVEVADLPAVVAKTSHGAVRGVRVGDLPASSILSAGVESGNILVIKESEGEEPYRNNPVTNAIFKEINEKGAANFTNNHQAILKSAGFDFDNDMLLLGVGERLMEAQKWQEGIALYTVYTNLFPRIVVSWNHLGKCKKATGDMPGAKAAWEKSVSLRPKNNPAVEWLRTE